MTLLPLLLLHLLLLLLQAAAPAAAAYSARSLLLVRVASGPGAATACPSVDAACNAATELFLDEYLPSIDGLSASLVATTPLTGVTLSATDFYQGALSLCADGTCAVLGATAAAPGQAPSLGPPYFAADRVIVRVAANGSVDTSTRVAAADYQGMIKGVCSFGSSAGSGGGGYFLVGNATTSCVSYVKHGARPGSGDFANVATGSSCDTAQGPMDGRYTTCLATAASAPGAPSFNRTLLFARSFDDYALVDTVVSPEASWTQARGLQLLGTTTDVIDNGFSDAYYYSQLVASRSQDLFFLADPFGASCDIDTCRGKDAFPTVPVFTGNKGCRTHIQYLNVCSYSGITFSLDERMLYFTSLNRLVSYPVAGGTGRILVTLPPGQEFRGVSRAPFECGGSGIGSGGANGSSVPSGPVGSPLEGYYCPNGAGSALLPCPAGRWSSVGATTNCSAPLPSPSQTPSPSPTRSVTASPSYAPPGGSCWAVSTLAGPDYVTPNIPTGLAHNGPAGLLYVADFRLHEIVTVSTQSGVVSQFAGSSGERATEETKNGVGTNARFRAPIGLAWHEPTGDLYVADSYFALIRVVSSSGNVSTLAGFARGPLGGGVILDGDAATARFRLPSSLAIDAAADILYVMDGGAALRAIRGLHSGALTVATIAGSGVAGTALNSLVGTSARFSAGTLGGIALDAARGRIFIADYNNHAVRLFNLSSTAVSTIAAGRQGLPVDAFALNATMWLPTGVALSPDGGTLYVGEWTNAVVRKVVVASPDVPSTVAVTVLAGDTDQSEGVAPGVGTSAKLPWPAGLAADKATGAIFASIYFHATIVKIVPATAQGVTNVTIVASPSFLLKNGADASRDGTGLDARFSAITAVAMDPNDNLFVVDRGASKIRKITSRGVVTTLSGALGPGLANGAIAEAKFLAPTGVAVSEDGSTIFVSDTGNRIIRVISVRNNTVATLAGSGLRGAADGDYKRATFFYPAQIATFKGAVFVLDSSEVPSPPSRHAETQLLPLPRAHTT
jgi:sugar lactone lactonase YvrE